jgi:hypothetical protein
MKDVVEQTPAVTGLDRFTAALADELEAHARTFPVHTPVKRGRRSRWPRRVAIAAATGAAAAGVLAGGLGMDRAGAPAEASAASVMRASAAALPSDSSGLLPPGAHWHTRVDVTMRHGGASRDDFQYTTSERWETWQSRDGSGRERITPSAPVDFPTPADRSSWLAAGSPDLAESPSDRRLRPADRPFAFGADSLTYAQLERLPTDPSALASTLTGMVERQRGEIPATFDAGQARAYLLFTLIRDSFEAPTSPALRAALYTLTSTTPGLQLSGAVTDHAGRTGTAVTVVLGDARFVLIVDPRTGALLETQRILLRAGRQFPGMTPGLISRATFLESDVVSRFPS